MDTKRRKIPVSLWLAAILAMIGFAVTTANQASAEGDHGHDKPWVCHPVNGNGETGTGWNLISPDKASSHIDEATGAGKHTSHDGRTDVYAVDGKCPSPPVECPDRTQVPHGDECPPVQCPDGTTVPNGDDCPPVECPDGTSVPNGQECPVDECPTKPGNQSSKDECPPVECPDGSTLPYGSDPDECPPQKPTPPEPQLVRVCDGPDQVVYQDTDDYYYDVSRNPANDDIVVYVYWSRDDSVLNSWIYQEDNAECEPDPEPEWSTECSTITNTGEVGFAIRWAEGSSVRFVGAGQSVTLSEEDLAEVMAYEGVVFIVDGDTGETLGEWTPKNCEPTDQCPDGSNPGDANGDGEVNEEDCDYVPPTNPTTPPTGPTTPPTQPPAQPTTPPTVPVLPNTSDDGSSNSLLTGFALIGLSAAGIAAILLTRRRRVIG